MSAVKKTLKALLKTITHPVQQANDELEGKKFWIKDITVPKKKNEEIELDESSGILIVHNKDTDDLEQSLDRNNLSYSRKIPHDKNHVKYDFGYDDGLAFKHAQKFIKSKNKSLKNISEEVELDEAKARNDAEYKKAAKLAAEMTAYANSLKNNDEKASEAHLKAIDAQWAAYQAGLAIGHKDRLTHLSIGNKHLDKTGLHDLDEDAQAAGAITAHVNKVHGYMKAENAKKSNPESRGAVLNRTNQALKAAHGHNAPQITRLKDDDDTPANITSGKLTHHTPEQVIMRHYGQTASASTHAHSNNTANKTNEGINMNLTPVQKKIRQIVENFTSREELDEAAKGVIHTVLLSHDSKSGDGSTASRTVKLFAPSREHAKRYAIADTEKLGFKNVKAIRATPASTSEAVDLDEAFDGTHVIIEKPGHFLHGKKAAVFHHHADGSLNVQVRTGRGIKDNEIHNVTVKPHEYKTLDESVELDEAKETTEELHARVQKHNKFMTVFNKTPTRHKDFDHPDLIRNVPKGYKELPSGKYRSTELDEVSDKLKGTPWDPAYKTKTQPKSNRTITKFKAPGSSGVEVTQVRHDNDNDDVYDEDGNLIKKTEEPKEKRGRGRPAGAKSGARTHGADGGVKNQAVYGGHQFSMPNFGKK